MALLREFRDDEYTPEFGTLALRDAPPSGQRRPPEPAGPPRDYPPGAQPCGTIVRTGDGYLEGAARDGMHLVRLELHDGPPPDDLADWLDVVETPYLCRTGAVGLTDVTGGHAEPDLALDGPGRYAVRASRPDAT